MNNFFHFVKKLFCLLLLFLSSCIDPVEPVFNNREGLIYIDAFISTSLASSFVTVSESILESSTLKFQFVNGAEVKYRDVENNIEILLEEQENSYVPPIDFVAEEGSVWELLIVLPNGSEYRSSPERITTSIPISNIQSTYDSELIFRESAGRFLPGHSIAVDVDDPVDSEDYYFWKFTSFENLEICQKCTNSIYRNGACEDNPVAQSEDYTVDYLCDQDCWLKRYNESIAIFSDEFTNGMSINALPVADVPLYSKENIVVEVRQFSLTRKAYEYYKVLKDIVDNNGGLNAPPPAALIGNMFNPQDNDEFVLGRFTGAASVKRSVFIERESIVEPPIEENTPLNLESCFVLCLPEQCNGEAPPCSAPLITSTSCSETRFRTAIIPEGWIE